jgi:hypothetical protein
VRVGTLPPPSVQPASEALPALQPANESGGGDPTRAAAPVAAPSPGLQLDGLLSSPLSFTGLTPPDMGLAVGNGFQLQMVNLSGKIWSGSGSVSFSLSSFFGSGGDQLSDPWVTYDPSSGTWFAAILDEPAAGELLAVSWSSDPTGAWSIYFVPEVGCPDQGKFGLTADTLTISANVFSGTCAKNGGFTGDIMTVINKWELIDNVDLPDYAQGQFGNYFSAVPANTQGTTDTQWLVAVNPGSATSAHILELDGIPPDVVTLGETFTPAVRKITSPPKAVQPGTSTPLDTGDNRVQSVFWSSNMLIATLTDGCLPSSDNKTRSCARVLEFNTNSGGVAADLDLARAGEYLFYPAAVADANGTIVVTYGRSSSTLAPELDAQALGMYGAGASNPILVESGNAANLTQHNRYGDYFAAALDPDQSNVIWVAGEVGGHNSQGQYGWGTAVGQLTVSDPPAQPTYTDFNPYPGGNGRAVTVDPATDRLFYTFSGDPTIYVSTPSGTLLGTINPIDQYGDGLVYASLSWDAKRGVLWGGRYDGSGIIDQIPATYGYVYVKQQFAFPFPADSCYDQVAGYPDGLAYDEGPTPSSSDDSLWFSDDAGTLLFHTKANGKLISATTMPGCNTGVAIDNGSLWLAFQTGGDTGPFQIAEASTTSPGKILFSFPFDTTSDLPGPEAIAIDRATDPGSCLIWSNQYGGSDQLTAWTIPCTYVPQPRPTVKGISPSQGLIGASVTLTGTHFTGADGAKPQVAFNGTAATVDSYNDNSLQTTVPSGASTGTITVTSDMGTGSSNTFSVIVKPGINTIAPIAAKAGAAITINGSGFAGTQTVMFNGATAKFTVKSNTAIVATVPPKATTGPVDVTNAAGTAIGSTFTVIIAPSISGFTPTSGTVGATISVSGNGFAGTTKVKLNGKAMSFQVMSNSTINATIPTSATSGKVTVINPAGQATSSGIVTVTP